MLAKLPNYIYEKIASIYKDEYLYIQPDLFFDSESITVSGKIKFRYSPYLRKGENCLILNNPEAVFCSNQLIIIALLCLLARLNNIGLKEEDFHYFQENAQLIPNFIAKKQEFSFTKPVFCSEETLCTTTIETYKNTSKGLFVSINTTLGNEKNMVITSLGFVLTENLHGDVT